MDYFPCLSNVTTLSPNFQGHTLLGRVDGADRDALLNTVGVHTSRGPAVVPMSKTSLQPAPAPDGPPQDEKDLEARMRGLMSQSKVVLFMKGSPDAPRCGFSRQIVALLRDEKIEFSHFDILTDESVRQGKF